MLLHRRSERTLLMSEKFTFDKLGRDSSTVHIHIRHIAAQTLLMKTPGHQLLTGTIRTSDENPGISRSHLLYHIPKMLHRSRIPYHLLTIDTLLKIRILSNNLSTLSRILDSDKYPIQIQRLLNKIESTLLNTLYSRIDITMT